MSSEPFFLYEDESYTKELNDIAKNLNKNPPKISREAIVLKQILLTAIKQQKKPKKKKTFQPKKINSILPTFHQIKPIAQPKPTLPTPSSANLVNPLGTIAVPSPPTEH
ncbi:hypothetical protein CL622_02250 [archaeon]|nr:hypothetical protein [archaeon]|tara:strand:- start:477 stop:803 length:327 start_codon:yes stop_codon:yes gene_type:complete